MGPRAPQNGVDRLAPERDAYVRSILEVVPDAVIVIDDRGLIQTFSTAAERMFGYARAEVIGRNISMLMPSPYRERHDFYLSRYIETGQRRILGIGRVIVAQRKDGSIFPIELNVSEIHAEGRILFTGFIRDLTERQATEKRLQELQDELAHVARLSALGEMASVLAHELNQPLAAISLYLETSKQLLTSIDVPQQLGETLGKANAQALRAGEIIRRMRGFVKKEPAEHSLHDINKTVEEAAALALVGAKSLDISASLVLEPDLPAVSIDRIAIQQVVLNLVRNAIEAMAGSPRRALTITTRMSSGMVEIAVADTGPGLAPEIAARLFQPFLTTKPDGLGIGLSVCRSIVEIHRGGLWAEANPQGGTTFNLTLPLANPPETPLARPDEAPRTRC